jgi:hypothetical protein
MALSLHELGMRLARHLGVTALDPGDVSNTSPLSQAAARPGDLDDIAAALNGALQEMWTLSPRGVRALYPDECPVVTAADLGAAGPYSSGSVLLFPKGWEESVLLPLALRRLSVHPDFQPATAKAEIERQAAMALRVLLGLDPEGTAPAVLSTHFR